MVGWYMDLALPFAHINYLFLSYGLNVSMNVKVITVLSKIK